MQWKTVSGAASGKERFRAHHHRNKDGDREKLIANYEERARRHYAVIAPVGQAWKSAQEKRSNLDLYVNDGLHVQSQVTGGLNCPLRSIRTSRTS